MNCLIYLCVSAPEAHFYLTSILYYVLRVVWCVRCIVGTLPFFFFPFLSNAFFPIFLHLFLTSSTHSHLLRIPLLFRLSCLLPLLQERSDRTFPITLTFIQFIPFTLAHLLLWRRLSTSVSYSPLCAFASRPSLLIPLSDVALLPSAPSTVTPPSASPSAVVVTMAVVGVPGMIMTLCTRNWMALADSTD